MAGSSSSSPSNCPFVVFVVVVAARSGQIENYLMVQWLPLPQPQSRRPSAGATVKRAPSAKPDKCENCQRVRSLSNLSSLEVKSMRYTSISIWSIDNAFTQSLSR